jgi:putative methionine-R-sulfoxide reductase with GAF domain
MVWNSIFDNDAHKIVSKQGQKELLIQIMKHDEEIGMYDIDSNEKKSKENLD